MCPFPNAEQSLFAEIEKNRKEVTLSRKIRRGKKGRGMSGRWSVMCDSGCKSLDERTLTLHIVKKTVELITT